MVHPCWQPADGLELVLQAIHAGSLAGIEHQIVGRALAAGFKGPAARAPASAAAG
jgi:hypothetical protein